MKSINGRTTEYGIDDVFLKRFSPRAMSGEDLSNEELMTLFDAARWAPSAANMQPWRFVYANHGTEDFNLFISFLHAFNQDWAKQAGALLILLSHNKMPDGSPATTSSFDAGAAWENLALQGAQIGLVVHAMAGFDKDLLRSSLNIPEDYTAEAIIAVGKPGDADKLHEKLREREKPSSRKSLDEIIFKGSKGVKRLQVI